MVKQSVLVAVVPTLFVAYAWFTPVAHASFAAFTVYRIGQRAPVPPEERAPYVAAGRPSRSTPVAVDLDPRAPAPIDDVPAEEAA